MKFVRKIVSVLLAFAIAVSINVTAFAASIALPDNEAIEVVYALGTGWNLGNAFDAVDCTWLGNEMDYESGWCNAKTTRSLISELADIGFQNIRIPVSWYNHIDSNLNISEPWLNRVQEVIDWCLEEDLFVILDVHHDVETNYYYPSPACYDNSEKFLTTIWKQLAERFKDYDHRLIFETINEPRLKGHTNEWWFDMNNIPSDITNSVECINDLNQAALDVIRASGGMNADRYVLIPGYDTSVDGLTISNFKMPVDTVDNRLIADFHLYTADTNVYKSVIDKVYSNYVSKGIPAILSEYNIDANENVYTDSSASYLSGMVAYAKERGISSIIWDNNDTEYKLIDRATSTWVQKDIAEAIVRAGRSTISLRIDSPAMTDISSASDSISVSWKSVSGAEYYNIYRATSLNGTKTKIASNITALTYTDKTVESGNTYYYYITAYDKGFAKESDYSSPLYTTVSAAEPVPPANVTATAGDNSVKISWSAVSGATKYRVQKTTGSSWSTIVYPTATSYTDTDVTNGTTYKYRVLAYVNGAWSEASSAVSATPFSTTPQNLKTISGDGIATIIWDAVNGATKYRVQRLNGTTWTTIKYPTTTSYTDTGLTNGTTYRYRVLAYVNGAWSNPSSAVSARPAVVDKTPKNVKAVAGDGKVTVSWSSVSGATKYRLQRTTGSSWTTIVYPTATSYTDTSVTNGTAYKYRVLAYVNGAWSNPSAVVSATPVTADTTPKNVKATASDGKVTISWSAVSGATKYRLQRTTGSSWSTIVYPTATSYTDTGVTNGTTYKYRVLAYVNGAWGTPSSAVSAIPTSAVPQNVSVINGDGKVTISWSNVSGATKYRLQRTTGSSWSTIVYPSATSYTDTSVTNGTTYKYRVLAYVNGAWSTPSDYATATPDEKTIRWSDGNDFSSLLLVGTSRVFKFKIPYGESLDDFDVYISHPDLFNYEVAYTKAFNGIDCLIIFTAISEGTADVVITISDNSAKYIDMTITSVSE